MFTPLLSLEVPTMTRSEFSFAVLVFAPHMQRSEFSLAVLVFALTLINFKNVSILYVGLDEKKLIVIVIKLNQCKQYNT